MRFREPWQTKREAIADWGCALSIIVLILAGLALIALKWYVVAHFVRKFW